MNTDTTRSTDSISSDATELLGELLGAKLRGGEVIELISDLGGGKTTFVRGLARGIGSTDHVSSPTFKISNVYKGSKLQLYHYDFYRLHEPGLLAYELNDALSDRFGVIAIEWGEVVKHVLPKKRLTIHIRQTAENTRHFEFQYPKSLQYLVAHI